MNLTLEILGRRADGFHELRSLVHTINLADDLRVEPSMTLLVRTQGLDIAPQSNLVVRAAQALAASSGVQPMGQLTLFKNIPAAAGLGGGSTDAAATLVALNALWRARRTYMQLVQLARELGSDVPFFVRGGAALMRGRGDDVQALPPLQRQWLVLVVPSHTLVDKTARLYAALRELDFSSGDITQRAVAGLEQRAPIEDAHCVNGFARAARATFPGLDELWSQLERVAQRPFHLSGAGPSLFALAADRADAMRIARRIQDVDAVVHTARTVVHARTSVRDRP